MALTVAGCSGSKMADQSPPPTGTTSPLFESFASFVASEQPSNPVSATQSVSPSVVATDTPNASPGRFLGGVLIADRLNDRLIAVNEAGTILWRFPIAGSLPAGETFSADDAFVSPDGKSVVANEEANQIVVRIDIATEQIVWEYGTFGVRGAAAGQLSTPDDAYPLPNGDISVADIHNCRIVEITPSGQLARQWGTTGLCVHDPPTSFAQPNGDTPLPDGGLLVTEIVGSRVVRLSPTGEVLFDIHMPARYPSDAHLLSNGDVLVADYSNPGAVLVVDPSTGATIYRYGPTSGDGRLNRPSLALPLADGTFLVNDDDNQRVVVIDPSSNSIVWTYGHLGQASAADGYLNLPDGVDVAPPGTFVSS